jgi:hypothetical protein
MLQKVFQNATVVYGSGCLSMGKILLPPTTNTCLHIDVSRHILVSRYMRIEISISGRREYNDFCCMLTEGLHQCCIRVQCWMYWCFCCKLQHTFHILLHTNGDLLLRYFFSTYSLRPQRVYVRDFQENLSILHWEDTIHHISPH